VSLPSLDQPFVKGSVETPVGRVPKVSSFLERADYRGTVKARLGIGRMNYTVDPGLYALGRPDEQAPVLVTANYKMSFDALRKALPGLDAWILVIDTKGINVWCAAGKGTFGTLELVSRIKTSGLEKVVKHRELILPQLSGPGIAAFQVKKLSDFRVIFGPIRAGDLPAFLKAGKTATPDMREKTFSFWERAVLIPVEIVGALKPALLISLGFFLLSGLGGAQGYWATVLDRGLFAVLALAVALFCGAVLTPLFLPWIPGRAFAMKGWLMGLIGGLGLRGEKVLHAGSSPILVEGLAWLFLISAISAYLAMNFTGASTYTSLSGVKKEMRWALPLEAGFAGIGLILWFSAGFLI
jgi:CO dehydrogenase/acetyl-CoA synthase delta subunit